MRVSPIILGIVISTVPVAEGRTRNFGGYRIYGSKGPRPKDNVDGESEDWYNQFSEQSLAQTMDPTPKPTTMEPSASPITGSPTKSPSVAPVTGSPTGSPTKSPSVAPVTASPTAPAGTLSPTNSPSTSPSKSPTTNAPTTNPTSSPSKSPTKMPTTSPSNVPTLMPVVGPTTSPPTASPSTAPTNVPTTSPSAPPTGSPSSAPSNSPTTSPSASPTTSPSSSPSHTPTANPSSSPSDAPSDVPTKGPSASPSDGPSGVPTAAPTLPPSASPTASPSASPSSGPTNAPTGAPTLPALNVVGDENLPSFTLNKCEGDCDDDKDCVYGLICYQRDDGEAIVPGCEGDANALLPAGADFCIEAPFPNSLRIQGNNGDPASAYPLGVCEADCDTDADCAQGLACFQRDGFEEVYGCLGDGGEEWDYCFVPSANDLRLVNPDNADVPDYSLQVCQGDCDMDKDCALGLVCYQRDFGENSVPGCRGSPDSIGDTGADDFCITPQAGNTLVIRGDNNQPAQAFPLGLCQGDCDSDADCAGGLNCFRRDEDEEVPGCVGEGQYSFDYCYNGPSTQGGAGEGENPNPVLRNGER